MGIILSSKIVFGLALGFTEERRTRSIVSFDPKGPHRQLTVSRNEAVFLELVFF